MLQPVGSDHYKISVVSKSGVPDFGPSFPKEGVVQINEDFKERLFTKLINGWQAAGKTGQLAHWNLQYRQTMLNQLEENLKQDLTRTSAGCKPWFCQVL